MHKSHQIYFYFSKISFSLPISSSPLLLSKFVSGSKVLFFLSGSHHARTAAVASAVAAEWRRSSLLSLGFSPSCLSATKQGSLFHLRRQPRSKVFFFLSTGHRCCILGSLLPVRQPPSKVLFFVSAGSHEARFSFSSPPAVAVVSWVLIFQLFLLFLQCPCRRDRICRSCGHTAFNHRDVYATSHVGCTSLPGKVQKTGVFGGVQVGE